jgi:two-component system, cell cycle sensor histidine kinase and response regulator CckA
MPFKYLDFYLFKDFPEPVFVMAQDGAILAANHVFSSRFESISENIIGRNVFELLAEINVLPEVIANRKNKIEEVLRTGKPLAIDDPMDGQIWRSSIYPVSDADGKIEKLLVLVQNVTEQSTTEAEMMEFRAKMDFALESSHVSVWSFDVDNDILLRTVEHDRIFGYDSLVPNWKFERFLGHIHPHDLPTVMGLYESSMANRSDFNQEFRIRRVDGEVRWINLIGTFRFVKPDSSRHIVGIILDITEKKLAALELEELQTQLQHLQKMEMVGQLAGGIAHDFNNALTAIIGNIELALAKIEPSLSVAKNLRDAHQSAVRSAQLTRQLLGFARKQMRIPKATSLNQEMENLIPMLRPLISEQIECVWLPGEHVPDIFIDPAQLDQLLTNLCVNAKDAIEETGTGTIIISTATAHVEKKDCANGHPCQSPGDYAVLSVSDTGSGIDCAVMPHIFEPFFTTKPVGKGTGLGLSTVYGIVRQNNGYIDCQSATGKGATFTIFLPKHQEGDMDAMIKAAMQSLKPPKKTVLLVEDEPNILDILKLALEDKGYRVIEALDAESALLIAGTRKEKIDLLATDIVLPRMNGIELSKQLQARFPELQLLFMSGFAFENTGSNGKTAKPVNFISKPFTIPDFMNMVRQVMQPK